MYDLKLRRLSYKAAMDVTVVRARNAGRTSLAYWSPEKGLLVAQGRQVSAPRKLLRVGMIEVILHDKKIKQIEIELKIDKFSHHYVIIFRMRLRRPNRGR
jgi:hypothetical protein